MTVTILTQWETWAIIGVALVILDLTVGLGFFVLSFGIGGLFTAVVIAVSGNLTGVNLLDTWIKAVLVFATTSLVILPVLRILLYGKAGGGTDINEY